MSHELWLYAIAVGVFASLVGPFSRSTTSNDQARINRLEAKVNLLLDKLGIEHDMPMDEVRGYLARGMKVCAIRAFRDQNPGVGLRAAKDAVEIIEAQIKTENFR